MKLFRTMTNFFLHEKIDYSDRITRPARKLCTTILRFQLSPWMRRSSEPLRHCVSRLSPTFSRRLALIVRSFVLCATTKSKNQGYNLLRHTNRFSLANPLFISCLALTFLALRTRPLDVFHRHNRGCATE